MYPADYPAFSLRRTLKEVWCLRSSRAKWTLCHTVIRLAFGNSQVALAESLQQLLVVDDLVLYPGPVGGVGRTAYQFRLQPVIEVKRHAARDAGIVQASAELGDIAATEVDWQLGPPRMAKMASRTR